MSKTDKQLSKSIKKELDKKFNYLHDENKEAYAVELGPFHNPITLLVEGDDFKAECHEIALKYDDQLTESEYKKVTEICKAEAYASKKVIHMPLRVAAIEDGIEIDKGDEKHTVYQVKKNSFKAITSGSQTYFKRSVAMLPLPDLVEAGDLNELKDYVTFEEIPFLLFVAIITFWLAHPKIDSTNYPLLILVADQGSGKTFLCKTVLRSLIDPSVFGVQTYPKKMHDLVLASQLSHLQIYDNVTYLSLDDANVLCVMSTGGSLVVKRLYSNSQVVNHKLHGPCLINGLINVVPTPDLASRCLMLELPVLEPNNRRSEKELMDAFNEAKPRIFTGLLKLISQVFGVLDDIEVVHKERMLDFSKWIAAIEKVQGLEAGLLQNAYHQILVESQIDSVMGDQLASAVHQAVTVTEKDSWSGTANELLTYLETSMNIDCGDTRSNKWPKNAIALSKRLRIAKAALLVQGVEVTYTRGKKRIIKILNLEAY